MFCGLSTTYSLVNVVADQLRMLRKAGVCVKVLVSETCPDAERSGIFLDPEIQWVKIVNTCDGKPFQWHDYSGATGTVHETFFAEAELIAQDFVRHLQDVDVCIMHDILYQGWHLVHNIAIRKAQTQLPNLRFLSFTPLTAGESAAKNGISVFGALYGYAQDKVCLSHTFRHFLRWQNSMMSRKETVLSFPMRWNY